MTEANDNADWGNITVPGGASISAVDPRRFPTSFVFNSGTKEVLRITPDGELVFTNVTEAATALKREWDRMRGV